MNKNKIKLVMVGLLSISSLYGMGPRPEMKSENSQEKFTKQYDTEKLKVQNNEDQLENNLTKFGTFKTHKGKTTLIMKDLPVLDTYKLEARQTFAKQLSSKQKNQIMNMEGLDNLKNDIQNLQNLKPSLMQRVKQKLSSLIGKGRSAQNEVLHISREQPEYVTIGGDANHLVARPADYNTAPQPNQGIFRDMVAYTTWGEGKGEKIPTSVAEAVEIFKAQKNAAKARMTEQDIPTHTATPQTAPIIEIDNNSIIKTTQPIITYNTGNTIKYETFNNGDGNIQKKISYKIDQSGNYQKTLEVEILYDDSGNKTTQFETSYNDFDKKTSTREVSYDINREIKNIITESYDTETGIINQKKESYPEERIEKIFQYYKNSEQVKDITTRQKSSGPSTWTIETFNENGNPTSTTTKEFVGNDPHSRYTIESFLNIPL